jgi:hypothetical protein
MLVFAAVLALLQPPPAEARARAIPPNDECVADRDFARYRAELLDVLARRDAEALRPLVAENVFFSFGGGEGRADFFTEWGLADPLRSGLWTELAETLMLGCAREGETMVAPFAFARWPEFDGIGMSYLALPGAELYARPARYTDPIARLAWDVVEEVGSDGDETESGWRRVRLADGRTGYVNEAELRIDIDYRAIFERRGERWALATFVAGD